uniref:Glycoprotein-N-acetylgalactosamine 3-beta-galactosyltransferase 1 n=1 Tax=Acrobeloides nanus TaxID=290746 RepID=A0A914E314_9BILA
MASFRRAHTLYFLFGFLIGCTTVFWNNSFNSSDERKSLPQKSVRNVANQKLGLSRQNEDIPDSHAIDDGAANEARMLIFQHEHEESELAKEIRENVRIFCWIMTSKNNTNSRAVHIHATWASRCNKHVFITANEGSDLPSIDLNVTEGRNYLWAKTKSAFKYIYEKELNNYDWFLKADDDTYVIVENLRFMLLAYSPNDPVYFGCKFKPFVKQGYMSGGSGYVLSREAVKRFAEDALPDPKKCKEKGTGAEDAEMGKCLEKVGVIAGDSRDINGKHRMLPFSPLTHLQEGGNKTMPAWFYKYMFYPYEQGEECCSDYVVSFHYVNKATLYALHNLIYHIRAFGVSDDARSKLLASSKDEQSLLESARSLAKAMSMPLESMNQTQNTEKPNKETEKEKETKKKE